MDGYVTPNGRTVEAAADATELVGDTPLLALEEAAPNLFAKVESFNPYSVKDRIAREMVDRAEAEGVVDDDSTLVEPTSGNTGIGLAFVAAVRGYDCVLVVPESASVERRQLARGLGATVEVVPAEAGVEGARERVEEIVADRADAVRLGQFENEANPAAHRRTTGPEIWRATTGGVDALVAGVGTGGTITGTARHLKQDRDRDVRTVAVEPAASPLLSAGETDDHGIQGIGPSSVPETLDTSVIDEARTVTRERAVERARWLGRETGVLTGLSGGAATAAAVEVAREQPDELTVVVLPDTGERYLSTDLFEFETDDERTEPTGEAGRPS
ncbi:PLP-dependent cysteine synthase family protein [Halobaculum sp. MBLA0143]|uniref:PLP-dependent cysteine synthase family protein n=1 Tax=Halobaculum sp. MBLA0143 TaxID=3079933 RepID=UPI003523F300